MEMLQAASATGRAETAHGWIWSALPADCGRTEVRGAPGLTRLLAQAGFASSGAEKPACAPADAHILCSSRVPSNRTLQRALAELGPDGALVVARGAGAGDVDRRPRMRRLARRVAIPARLALLPASRRLRRKGLTVWLVEPGAGRGPALVAARRRRLTVTESAAHAVEPVLGKALGVTHARVLSTGTLMCELAAGDGSRYLLRLAAGPAAALAAHGRAMQLRLVAAAPGPAVTDRLVPTLASGRLRGIEYTVEPLRDGAPPRSLTTALFDECIDFLVTLGRAGAPGAHGASELVSADAATMLPHLTPARAATLGRVAETLAIRLGRTATVWCHGDFWPGNVLVRDGRLVAVLDWDAATSDGLPVLDLLHAIAMGDRRLRRLPHGRRCVDGLWPLARGATDDRVRRYCERIGTRPEPVLLEALAVAYWLGRVARDVRMYADRTGRRTWMQLNVEQPLDALAAAGW